MIYIVTAHRWGWLNAPMYHVWAGHDRSTAEALARGEVIGRGDKVGCQVLECTKEAGEMRFKRVAYFPSTYHEQAPHYSPYIAMHQHLGQFVRDAVLHGSVWIPDPANPRYATTLKVEPPPWLVDEVTRNIALAKAQDEAGPAGDDENL